MRHKWKLNIEKTEKMKPTFVKVDICSVCTCERLTSKNGYVMYSRNKQMPNHYIECVDMTVENLKTID